MAPIRDCLGETWLVAITSRGDCAVVEVKPQRVQSSPLYLEGNKQTIGDDESLNPGVFQTMSRELLLGPKDIPIPQVMKAYLFCITAELHSLGFQMLRSTRSAPKLMFDLSFAAYVDVFLFNTWERFFLSLFFILRMSLQITSSSTPLTVDSIEGRTFLHDQSKLLHEKYIQYASRVCLNDLFYSFNSSSFYSLLYKSLSSYKFRGCIYPCSFCFLYMLLT